MRRIILLDAFGTVLFPACSISRIYWETAAECGCEILQQTIGDRFGGAFQKWFRPWHDQLFPDFQGRSEQDWRSIWWKDVAEAVQEWNHSQEPFHQRLSDILDDPMEDEKSRWRGLVAEVFDLPPDQPLLEQIFHRLWHRFEDPKIWQWDTGLLESCQNLKQEGYRLVLASNFDQRLHTIIRQSSLAECFEEVMISSELGTSKPSPTFYQRVLQRLHVSPGQIAMVGDRWCEDVMVPATLGIQSFWLISQHQAEREAVDDAGAPQSVGPAGGRWRTLTDLRQLSERLRQCEGI